MRPLALALVLAACTGPASTPEAPSSQPVAPDADQAHEHAHDKGKHGTHGHHPPDGATVQHRFDDPKKWSKVFDDPERDAWQKPAELVAAAGIQPGQVVADIGAGTGYLGPHLHKAVGPEGRVILADVEESLVAHMNERFADQPHVQARTIPMDGPGLSADEVDVVVFLDVVHHISGRVEWFTALREAVRPGGKVVIVDFKPGDIPVGPPPEHRLAAEQIRTELEQAGWRLVSTPDPLPHQFMQIYEEASQEP